MNTMRAVYRLSEPYKSQWIFSVIAAALAFGSSVALLAVSAWLIVTASTQPPILTLTAVVVSVRMFGISRAVFRYLERLLSHNVVFKVLQDVRSNVWNALKIQPRSKIQNLSRSDALNRLVSDVDVMADLWIRSLIPWISTALVVFLTTSLIAFWSPISAFVLLIGVVIAGLVIPLLTGKFTKKSNEELIPLKNKLSDSFLNYLDAVSDTYALNAQTKVLEFVERENQELSKAEVRRAWKSGLGTGLILTASGLVVLLLAILAIALAQSGLVNPAFIAVVALVPLALYEALAAIPQTINSWSSAKVSSDRVLSLRLDKSDTSHIEIDPFNPDLKLINVNVDNRLKPITQMIPFGTHLAIVGKSGSGKTTLINSILGLEDYQGEIFINGYEQKNVSDNSWRKKVAGLTQQIHLFDTTIRGNLIIAQPDATDSEIFETLEVVELVDFVNQLPNGLDTYVGILGSKLSGGEKQRIALARALLTKAQILVLDEPTEYLDKDMSLRIANNLVEFQAGKTLIVSTHKLSEAQLLESLITL